MLLKVSLLQSLAEKSIGLIGKKYIKPVYFKTRWGIHTFGVLAPIDVIILDKGGKIVKTKENLKPGRVFFWNPKFEDIIEAPSGMIKNKQIKIGDKITLRKELSNSSLS